MSISDRQGGSGWAIGTVPALSEETVNSITHGVGFLLSLVATGYMMAAVREVGNLWLTLSSGIYCATLVAVYAASTLSHAVTEPRGRRFFRKLDQAVIYLLIVGTLTPFAMVCLRTSWWGVVPVVMWGGALLGFASKLFFAHRLENVSTISYVALGWCSLVLAWPMVERLPLPVVALIVLGGVFYTVGTLFLRLDDRVPYFHAVWHLLVMAGSTCHFVCNYWGVVAVCS